MNIKIRKKERTKRTSDRGLLQHSICGHSSLYHAILLLSIISKHNTRAGGRRDWCLSLWDCKIAHLPVKSCPVNSSPGFDLLVNYTEILPRSAVADKNGPVVSWLWLDLFRN